MIPRGFAVPLCGMAQRQDVPLGYARQLDGNGGVRVALAWRLHETYKTYKTYKMMMGAPVFALMGYAAASHDIPRGFAVLLCGMAQRQDVPLG